MQLWRMAVWECEGEDKAIRKRRLREATKDVLKKIRKGLFVGGRRWNFVFLGRRVCLWEEGRQCCDEAS
jgi:hypothetical protein